jgi:hypothetical protein
LPRLTVNQESAELMQVRILPCLFKLARGGDSMSAFIWVPIVVGIFSRYMLASG